MIYRLIQAMLAISLATHTVAQEVDIASLGKLELIYDKARIAQHYPGQQVAAEVAFKKGEAFTVVAPGRIQQIEYLVEVGSSIARGEPLAVLRGPEIHHLLFEFEASKKMLEAAERRFNSNKILYERKSIRESQWIEVAEKYYAAQLEYEHMRHFTDMVISIDETTDSITLAAPTAGIVDYSPEYGGIKTGESIAVIVPEEIIRLEVAVPAALRNDLAFLKMPDCQLDIVSVGAKLDGFFVTGWTEPLKAECNLLLGQHLLATPFMRAEVYQVATSAVFQWQKSSYILVRAGDMLSAVEVDPVGAIGTDYLVQTKASLQDKDILVSSVSAVQGILLGLGGE